MTTDAARAGFLGLLRLPGAAALSASGLVARMPSSMVRLAIVLLGTAATGSYALAGALAGTYVLVSSAVGPFQARLADRWGQRRLLAAATAAHTAALGALIVTQTARAPGSVALVAAAVAGAVAPPVGSYVRARWVGLVPERSRLQSAFALEAVVDELVFIAGPSLATTVAAAIGPAYGLGTAAALGLGGCVALILNRRTEPTPQRRHRTDSAKVALGWRRLAPLTTCYVAVGVLFGSAEIVVVAIASAAGHPALSGPLLAGWAAGSLISALIVGVTRVRRPPLTRFRIGLVAVAATMAPLPLAEHPAVLAVLLVLTGSTLAPTLIAGVGIVHESVPQSRVTEGMTWVSGAQNAGFAAGAALVGPVIDVAGTTVAAGLPLVAGLAAVAVSVAVPRVSGNHPVPHIA